MREHLKENIIPKFLNSVKELDENIIEDSIIDLYLENKKTDNVILKSLVNLNIQLDIETVTYLFEALLDEENVNENGIVFTPQYIANYICDSIWLDISEWSTDYKIIDPGCGCGIFLASAILYIKSKFNVPVVQIIKNNIYGIDLDVKNAKRCRKIIKAIANKEGFEINEEDIHIVCADSLKENWRELFCVDGFNYIIGNPPYVNTHDMNKETAIFLKQNFETTKTGVYNIFYAFIEKAMHYLSDDGKLSYIIPNNFLTIKSATELRNFLQSNNYIESILDFADNMVFKPVRTYNCIIILSKADNTNFKYCVMDKYEDIERGLETVVFETMPLTHLDKNGWKLVNHETYENIKKIESQFRPIKDFIRTGIATLRDEVYMVNYENGQYFKNVDGTRYEIEQELVKKLYKIPELKNCSSLNEVCRYIIFPYKPGRNGFEIIPEEEFIRSYPNTYTYLRACKSVLDERDKGKPNSVSWYAYGRTQGLNKYGKKLLFPTFADTPKFMYVDDEYALFCNGYGIFENDYLELDELMPILNSKIMRYYVSNTSYAIEGGYYCYQKKYIERFSLPYFNEEERLILRNSEQDVVDEMLLEKYNINL